MCFLLNPEKIWKRSVLSFLRKKEKGTLIPKNDVTDPKARRLSYSKNQLKAVNILMGVSGFRKPWFLEA